MCFTYLNTFPQTLHCHTSYIEAGIGSGFFVFISNAIWDVIRTHHLSNSFLLRSYLRYLEVWRSTGREGTLDCKINWSPNTFFHLLDLITLNTLNPDFVIQALSVQTFQPITLIYKRPGWVNFVYHNLRCASIYLSLSYPFRSHLWWKYRIWLKKNRQNSIGGIASKYFLKAKLFYNLGRSASPSRLALFVNLGMLKLSYRFQTLNGDSCSRKVLFRKHPYVHLKHDVFFLFWHPIFVYPIHLIFGILIPITTRYSVISDHKEKG